MPRPRPWPSFVDRLQQRLGRGAVRQLHPHQSHIPERRAPSPRCARAPHLPACGERVGVRGSSTLRRWRRLLPLTLTPLPARGRGNHITRRDGSRTRPAPSSCCPARAGRGGGADPGRAAAAVPLARRAAPGGATPRAPSASHRNGGASPDDDAERDYYVVEDSAGRRFWLYRAGLYGRGAAPPQWFVHGVLG